MESESEGISFRIYGKLVCIHMGSNWEPQMEKLLKSKMHESFKVLSFCMYVCIFIFLVIMIVRLVIVEI